MHSEGIEVQPINTLDSTPIGHHEVNTVFFEDVKVPKENLVGEEGKGWTYAKYLLEFERGNARVEVNFDSSKTKWLMVSYAKLQNI